MFSKTREKFRSLKPEAQQRFTIAAIIFVIAFVATLVYVLTPVGNEKKPVTVPVESKSVLNVDNKMLEKSLTGQMNEQRRNSEDLKKQIEALQQQQQGPGNTPVGRQLDAAIAQKNVPLGPSANVLGQSATTQPANVPGQRSTPKAARNNSSLPPLPVPPPPEHDGHPYVPSPQQPDYRLANEPRKTKQVAEIGHAENNSIKQAAKPGNTANPGEQTKKKEKHSVYLPPSFMGATLLSGLLAPTAGAGKNNPIPVLINIDTPAVLPSGVRADLARCFVIAEGVGSLRDNRAHLRTVSISCLSRNGRAVIDQEITGFVQDADGFPGLSGNVVAKFGTLVARAALAGLIGGLGDAAAASTSTVSSSPLGQTQSFSTDDLNKIGLAGLGRGVSNASKEIQKFEMDLAHESLPVIEVLNGKRITLVITKGVNLEIKNYKPVPWR